MSGLSESRAVSRDYGFRARDAQGRRRTGVVSAATHVHATKQLRDQGLFPIEVNAIDPGVSVAEPKEKRASLFKRSSQSRRLSARQRAEFISRLAKLAGAKISIDRALKIVADGETGATAHAAQALRTHIREGGSFTDGLKTATGIDDAATLALVRGAETSGELDVALATAAGILEQRLATTRRIVTGLLYPSLLMIVSLISVGVIMIAIIPQFRPLVEDRMEFVPFLGRAVFGVSATLAALWPIILTGLIGMAVALLWLQKSGKAGPILARTVSRLPLARDLLDRNHTTMALHVLGALLKRGVTLSEALRVVAASAPVGAVRSAVQSVSRSVGDGLPLAESFAKSKILAPSAVEMLRIGEETGDLDTMCTRAAAEMREASERSLERFLALFQPMMIVIVGALVGVSLYALFSAIISVNQIAF